MSNEEVNETISEIMDVLSRGDFDSKKQLEDLTAKLETVFAPAIALEELRFREIGEHLFEFTWNSRSPTMGTTTRSNSIPLLRFDGERLEKFLMVLERQRMLSPVIRTDPLYHHMNTESKRKMDGLLDHLDRTERDNERAVCIKLISKYIANATKDGLLNKTLPHMLNTSMFELVRQHTRPETMPSGILGTKRELDYQALGEKFLEDRIAESQGEDRPQYFHMVSLVAALAFYSNNPHAPRVSQKARGIQALSQSGHDFNTHTWVTKPSVPISLADALNVDETTLSATIYTVWAGRVEKFWADGCFIRTCPESPRAGALENSHTFTTSEACKEIRGLAAAMLDDSLPDYDPMGELVMMKFERPSCSGVMVKGHRHLSVGPIHDGATNTRGTLIHLSLNQILADEIADRVLRMRLNDKMKFHEIELVWSEDDGPAADLTNLTRRIARNKHDEKHVPTCTQIRGLPIDKEPLFPPAVVDGETLFIRGAVPEHGHGLDSEGKVVQETYIDVEKGDLSDCMELEQMAKSGMLPEGLVVYVSAGGPMCHAAGVSREFGFPIIFGQKPFENGTLWTEIRGWMCQDKEDVEAEPYDPSITKEYYQIGIEDGDRFWNFGNVALSSFLHTYMSGGVNDPRFEAYLAGVYSSWLVKATLATALGEMRHAYTGKARMTPDISLRHLLAIKSLCRDGKPDASDDFEYFDFDCRSEYYGLLINNKIGMDYIITLLENCRDCFSRSGWSGSFGGKKYMESVNHAISCAMYMKGFANGDVDVNVLLGKVNSLENAVHNTGAFFNKFVRDKYWFDMATAGGHSTLNKVAWQYHVAAAYHTRFYDRILEESWVCYEGYKDMHEKILNTKNTREIDEEDAFEYRQIMAVLESYGQEAMDALVDGDNIVPLVEYLRDSPELDAVHMEKINHAVRVYCVESQTYCEDCDSYDCGCYDATTKQYHKEGTCGMMSCPNSHCQQIAFTASFGVDKHHLELCRSASSTLKTHMSLPSHYPSLFKESSPTLEIAKIWSPSSEYTGDQLIPIDMSGETKISSDTIKEIMELTPLKNVNKEVYHPASNVWVEPDREIDHDKAPVIEVYSEHVTFPLECELTENLPPVLAGTSNIASREYHWLGIMTNEVVRRIWSAWDVIYGVERDEQNIMSNEDITIEKEILNHLSLMWRSTFNYHDNHDSICTDIIDDSIMTAMKNMLCLRDRYSSNGKYNFIMSNVQSTPQEDTLRVMLTSPATPLWLNDSSFNASMLYREMLLAYYQNLNKDTFVLAGTSTSFGGFAELFIKRYDADFAEKMAIYIPTDGNDGSEKNE